MQIRSKILVRLQRDRQKERQTDRQTPGKPLPLWRGSII